MSSTSAGSSRRLKGVIHTPEGIILESVDMTNVKDGFNHAQFGVIGSGLQTRASQPLLPSTNVQRVHVNKRMSEPGFRAPHSGHQASAHANMYAHLERISRGVVSHLGLPSPVTNGEEERSRASVTAEGDLLPAFERFGFGGPDGNRLASSDGHEPRNEPEWSNSMLDGSDGTGNSAGPMITTTSNNSSGEANPTTMSLQTFVQSAPDYHQGFHDIQASQIVPCMAGNGTEFSTMGHFDGFQGPHPNNNFGGNFSQSNGYGYSWLPSVGTPGYDYYQYVQTLQQQMAALNQALYQQAVAWRERYEHTCSTAMNHINIRDGHKEALKLQLRGAGLHPVIEPIFPAEAQFWKDQLGMLFRNLSCWAKKYYKFPPGVKVPAITQTMLSQVCHDSRTMSNLMRSNHTKYMVIVSLATRWLVSEIFDSGFLEGVVPKFAKSDSDGKPNDGFREAMATAKSNPGYSLRMYEAIQSAATKRAEIFLKNIHSLSSRPTDKEHLEKSAKSFIDVVHQASRMVFAAKKEETSFFFHFPSFGELFVSEDMKEVVGDTLGLNVAQTNPILRELHGAQIRLCMLPRTWVYFEEPGNKPHLHETYKANVLVFVSSY